MSFVFIFSLISSLHIAYIYVYTFSSSKVEVEICYVGAALVALRRAQLLNKMWIQQTIWWNSQSVPIQTTRFDALVRLDPVLQSLRLNLRWSARVLLHPSSPHTLLKHASCARGRHRKCARALVQVLARDTAYHTGQWKLKYIALYRRLPRAKGRFENSKS